MLLGSLVVFSTLMFSTGLTSSFAGTGVVCFLATGGLGFSVATRLRSLLGFSVASFLVVSFLETSLGVTVLAGLEGSSVRTEVTFATFVGSAA